MAAPSNAVSLQQRQAAVSRFAARRGNTELPKDNVPQRKVQRMNREQSLQEFKERTHAKAGDREQFGHGHTQDVAEKTKQTRGQAAAQRFAKAKSQSQAPSKSAGKSGGMGRG